MTVSGEPSILYGVQVVTMMAICDLLLKLSDKVQMEKGETVSATYFLKGTI